MDSKTIRQKYLDFFKKRGHVEIPPAPLVSEDPTTLFTSAGMQPLIPYLLGEPHPKGKRLTNSQKCFRSQDIEEVGDNRHLTFFEMLGNWSLGDYFKKEQLSWFFEFLTNKEAGLGLDPNRLYVTTFAGSNGVPKDTESTEIWKELFAKVGIEAKEVEVKSVKNAAEVGMQGGKIFSYGFEKNWWSRFGAPDQMPVGEIGGPDSEVFYEFTEVEHDIKYGKFCHPNCDCGRFLEIGNSVFIQYKRTEDGKLVELSQKNVDFGGGLERFTAVSKNEPDLFKIDLFTQIIAGIEETSGEKYSNPENRPSMQVIADHLKASTFMIIEGVRPSNKLHGYMLRRLLRRSAVKMYKLRKAMAEAASFAAISDAVLKTYDGVQGADRAKQRKIVEEVILEELRRFSKTLERGLKEIQKIDNITGKIAFDLYQTYGFPLELTEELALEKGQKINRQQFEEEFKKHQEISRTASAGMFKGGLADRSEETTKLHTATHLLHASLRQILGTHVSQKGSNITSERLRFDFSHPQKLTAEQIKKIEELVNEEIREGLPVTVEEVEKEKALSSGAMAFFGERYGDRVTVYSIGDFSKEICGGPHVKNTSELGTFKITKEESAGSGVRRIYATVG